MTKKNKKEYDNEVCLYIHHYNPPFKKKFGINKDAVFDFLWWNFRFVYKDAFDEKQYVQELMVACMIDKYEGKVSFNSGYSEIQKNIFDSVFNTPPHNFITVDKIKEPKKNCCPISLTINMEDYKDLNSLLIAFIEKEIFVKLDSVEAALKENQILIYKNELTSFIENAKDMAKQIFTVDNFDNIKNSSSVNDILLFNYLNNNAKFNIENIKAVNKKKI